MDWVKRNLVFVIGSVVALVLLLLSGFYLFSNSQKNNTAKENLEREYREFQRLSNLDPHPGKGSVDNIGRAKDQEKELIEFMATMADRFETIPAIPASSNVTGEAFSAALRQTVDRLTRTAAGSSVILPANYNFSFEAQKRLVKFAPGSLDRLAVQLGDVKAICDILFEAKVNKLEGLRRERVSRDDATGPQTDYISESSETNGMAVLSPYQITFESFSAELAKVLAGFAASPHGMVIEAINVRPASGSIGLGARGRFGETEASVYRSAPTRVARFEQEQESVVRSPVGRPSRLPTRGGGEFEGGRGRGAGDQYGIVQPTFNQPGGGAYGGQGRPAAVPRYTAPTYRAPNTTYATRVAAPGATSQTVIEEQPLNITMVVKVVKLLPPQE